MAPSSARDLALPRQLRFGPLSSMIGVVGGLLTGACIAAAAYWVPAESAVQAIERVPVGDVETAAQSLAAGSAAALVGSAKACTRPLGVLVVRATGKAGGNIRFRSGGYVSPFIRLGPQAERVAVPFPMPVEVGHGQIFMDNNSDGADVFLVPGTRVGPGTSTRVINVHWNPKAPC